MKRGRQEYSEHQIPLFVEIRLKPLSFVRYHNDAGVPFSVSSYLTSIFCHRLHVTKRQLDMRVWDLRLDSILHLFSRKRNARTVNERSLALGYENGYVTVK